MTFYLKKVFQTKTETENQMAHAVYLNALNPITGNTYDFVATQKNLDRLGRRVTIAGYLVWLALFAFLCFVISIILQLKHIEGGRIFLTIGWLTYIPIVLLWIFKGRMARHWHWIPITK